MRVTESGVRRGKYLDTRVERKFTQDMTTETKCYCCGELPTAEGRTMCQPCLNAGCHPSYNCNRPMDEARITCERCGKTTTDPDKWDPEAGTGRIFCDNCWDHRNEAVR